MKRQSTPHYCKCGCGQLASRRCKKDGSFSIWNQYAKGHQPPPSLKNKQVLEKAMKRGKELRDIILPPFSKRIGKIRSKSYWFIKVPGYTRWLLEHRYIMEQHLGRKLLREEHVHHKDNDGLNNNLSNLEVLSHSQHSSLTNKGVDKQRCTCVCPHCNSVVNHIKKLR